MGYAGPKLRPYPVHHPVDVITHGLAAKAQSSIALAEKHRVTRPIMLRAVLMCFPVNLDDEPASMANEIQKVAAKGSLPSEVATFGTQPSQAFP